MELGELYAQELEMEAPATRKCLERIPEKLFEWKPQEKAMTMKMLAYTVSDIPDWIAMIVEKGEIDFATWEAKKINTTQDLLKNFDANMDAALQALRKMKDKELDQVFALKMGGQELSSASKRDSIGSSIRHLAHHRGQLTVYMRMNDIPIPSIYGPSGDDESWG